MSLAILSDRGAQILGGFDVTALAESDNPGVSKKIQNELKSIGIESAFVRSGLRYREIKRFLDSPETLGTTVRVFPQETPTRTTRATLYRIAENTVAAYVSARLPVILLANSALLFSKSSGENHATVIAGVRKRQTEISIDGFKLEEQYEFILHDPTTGPFVPVSAYRALVAAERCQREANKSLVNGPIKLLFVGSRDLKVHAVDCLKWISDHDHENYRKYICVPCSTEKEACKEQLLGTGISYESDFELLYLHGRDLEKNLGTHPMARNLKKNIVAKANHTPAEWCWVVLGHHPNGQRAWIFRSDKPVSDPMVITSGATE